MSAAVVSRLPQSSNEKVRRSSKRNDLQLATASPKPRSVNQIEQNRAFRSVQSLHRCLKMPVPELPAVLAYLRWLDRMEEWNGKRFPSSLNEVSGKIRGAEMYSWSGDFGNPIVLPKIKKPRDPEKYRSAQVKSNVFKEDKQDSDTKRRSKSHKVDSKSTKDSDKLLQKSISDFYKPLSLAELNNERPVKSKSANPNVSLRNNGKPTAFYIHAKEGFQYWPKELYKKMEPDTKYSFGNRFNPGRAGVINDRIYAQPRTNLHYWTEFQQRQNPIGSGNVVAGKILKN